MRIGIIGVGIVGNAVNINLCEKIGADNVFVYDKYKLIGKFEDILDTDIVFLCLPTLYSEIDNQYDKSAIYETCEKLSTNRYTGTVVVKSTVEPGTCENLSSTYKLHIIHNPEFLTANSAVEDFRNQHHIVIGITKIYSLNSSIDNLLLTFYKTYYPHAEITVCNSTESETVKLACNNFYAVKIQFFTEIYLLCKKIGIDYENVKSTMVKNSWINIMHTQVPGPDGNISYGGFCFPKDVKAMISYMKNKNTPNKIINACDEERNSIRND